MTVWPVKTLGEVCDFVRGVTYDKADARSETKSGFIPLLRATNITEKGLLQEDFVFIPSHGVRADQRLMSGDALITIASGSASVVGRSVLVEDPGEMTFGAFCGVLRPGPKILPRYLSHFMSSRSVRTAWSEAAQGTNINNLKRDDILQTECFLPSLDEQKKIVKLLDAATARVTELSACYEQARTHASNLFESACRTEFDDQHLKSPMVTLPDVSKNLDGRRKPITKSDRESGDVPYYGASGIVDYVKGHIFDEPTLLISEDGANLLARSTPIAFKADGKYWVNNHAHVVKFDSTVTETYVEIFLNSIPIDNWVTGAAQPKLTQAALNRIPIPMPPMGEQMQIVARLESMRTKTSEMVDAYDAKLSAAKNLRQSILEAAFAGGL
jgi:type I restriction enzyme S subunit